jgi:peptide deformylase
MILPIYGYGQPVLKRVGAELKEDHPNLSTLIEDMWETMYNARGVGLAAPQVGLSLRLFVVDTVQIEKEEDVHKGIGIKRVFINAQKLDEDGQPWKYEEGCLSIPEIHGEVERPARIRLRYQDEAFVWHEEVFEGMNARVIQHEYDHIDGVLFVEKLKPIKRRLIQRKLDAIRSGKVEAGYKMRFVLR